eukprot:3713980-Pyramimonas_sp.AAC.1
MVLAPWQTVKPDWHWKFHTFRRTGAREGVRQSGVGGLLPLQGLSEGCSSWSLRTPRSRPPLLRPPTSAR